MKNGILSLLLAAVLALSLGLVSCTAGVPDTPKYSLTISSTDGGDGNCVPPLDCTCGEGTEGSGGLPVPQECLCVEGTEVNIKAIPDPGYRFVGWTGDVETIANVKDATTTITMSGNYSIMANFEVIPPVQYSLTISSAEGGSVTSPGSGICTYDAGTVVSLTAKADEDYGFVKWTGDISSIADINASETTIIVNSDYSITATFAIAIYHWYDLDAVRDNLEGNYVLMNDLDATTAGYAQLAASTANGGRGWDPIGAYGRWDNEQWKWVGEMFKGTLYGRGHEIRDMFINRSGDEQVGLFGHVNEGVLDDIGVVNSLVAGGASVGGLVGWSSGGTIRDCYYGGSVTGEFSVGGLVGYYHGSLSNSYYNYDQVLINGRHIITVGALSDEDFQQWLANGKVLDINARLSQEDGYYVIDDISDFKQLLAFGQDPSLSFRLKADLDLSNDANLYIPYLAGSFDGNGHKISNLDLDFNDLVSQVGLFGIVLAQVGDLGAENVRITTAGLHIGGLAGNNMFTGTIVRCYSTGTVTQGGGLVGMNWGTIVDSYSWASAGLGGLAGGNTVEGMIDNSYSSGTATSGLTPFNRGTVTNSFWDTQTSGQATSAGGIGKTTAQMKSIATFSAAGWNITAVAPGERNPSYIWNIVDGQTYPFLSWQP